MKRLCVVLLVLLGHQTLADQKMKIPLLVRHQVLANQKMYLNESTAPVTTPVSTPIMITATSTPMPETMNQTTIIEPEMINVTTRPMHETTNQATAFSSDSSTTFSSIDLTTESMASTFWPAFSTAIEPGIDCGGEYNTSSGMIRHPLSGGNYQNNENCIWIIRAADPIYITFVTFDTEESYDYLYVRDGESIGSHELRAFTGGHLPNPVQTSTNAAHLLFRSDSIVTRTGFELHWEPSVIDEDLSAVFTADIINVTTRPMLETTSTITYPALSTTLEPGIGCGGEYNSSSGMIRYPLSGGYYTNNENCIWIIRATGPINITFVTFDIEERYDYLYVRDGESIGSHVLRNFTGDNVPSPVQTSTNSAHLLFTSDYSVTRMGFELHWEPSETSPESSGKQTTSSFEATIFDTTP